MATFQQMSYEELSRWIASGQGGQMAVDERNRRLASGDAIYLALQTAVNELKRTAPADHNVFLVVGSLMVHDTKFLPPHTFLFRGESGGLPAWKVMHFSQVDIDVVYVPKSSPDECRIVTGFAKVSDV
jgi:hypothetical protein